MGQIKNIKLHIVTDIKLTLGNIFLMEGTEEAPQMEARREVGLNFGLPLSTGVVSETFSNRLNDIFGGLQSLEQKHEETVATFAKDEEDDDERREDGEEEDGDKSVGEMRPPPRRMRGRGRRDLAACDLRRKLNDNRRQGVPNYINNPDKWKKYSLEDDGSSSLSKGRSADEVNTAVAVDFIQQLKKRKSLDEPHNGGSSNAEEDNTSSTSQENDSHVFQVPTLPTKQNTQPSDSNETETTSLYHSGSNHASKARCMETYEFGQGSSVAKKKKVADVRDNKEVVGEGAGIVLEHCAENDDENVDVSSGAVSDEQEEDKQGDSTNDGPVVFKRGRKNRAIRKRKEVEDDDTDDGGGGGDVADS